MTTLIDNRAEKKSGCNKTSFLIGLCIVAIPWLIVSVVLALVQSNGMPTVTFQGQNGLSVVATTHVPFITSFVGAAAVVGLPCFGAYFILAALLIFLTRHTKPVSNS